MTWAMHLGQEKHKAAMECVQRELPKELWDHVSMQPMTVVSAQPMWKRECTHRGGYA